MDPQRFNTSQVLFTPCRRFEEMETLALSAPEQAGYSLCSHLYRSRYLIANTDKAAFYQVTSFYSAAAVTRCRVPLVLLKTQADGSTGRVTTFIKDQADAHIYQ